MERKRLLVIGSILIAVIFLTFLWAPTGTAAERHPQQPAQGADTTTVTLTTRPTITGTRPPKRTATPSLTGTATATPTVTPTFTETPFGQPTATSTSTPTATATATSTSTVTSTATNAPNPASFGDLSGQTQSFSTAAGGVSNTNPFFQSLGTNGRTCGTCHIAANGWSISPAQVQAVFTATNGLDPLFTTNDGTDSPNMPMTTLAERQAATIMIQQRGVFRIDLPMPANADYTVVIQDPYGFATAQHLSLFRRPMSSAAVADDTGLMWDNREVITPYLTTNTVAQNIAGLHSNLMHQVVDATLGHAQASVTPSTADQDAIASLQQALFAAQILDQNASLLNQAGGTGGAVNLSTQQFFVGDNDEFGNNPTPTPFNPNSMTLFAPWANLTGTDSVTLARQSIARGEVLFNTNTFAIKDVPGLNDVVGVQTIQGSCSTCHNLPNIGGHSITAAMNTNEALHRTIDEPLYTFTQTSTGKTIAVNDPGVGLITGQFTDIGKFHVPVLRNLVARLPLFHDGSAHAIDGILVFYKARFGFTLTTQQETDFDNFLASL